MTDQEMIALLRDYAESCANGKPYHLNHGIILIIANRIEKLISDIEQRHIDDAIDTNYCSVLSKATLIYNIQYHLSNHCNTKEECIEKVKVLLENFEAKDNDGEDE